MKKQLEQGLIIQNLPVNSSIYRMVIQAPKIASEARSGQFVMVRVNDGFFPLLRRPFSLYRIRKDEGIIEIAYRIVGKGTSILSKKAKGEHLSILGPLGNGFRLPPADAREVWVMAGGIGIGSVRSLIEEIRVSVTDVRLVLYYGARTFSEFFDIDELSKLCDELKCSTDDGSFGFCGTVLGCVVNDWETSEVIPSYVYACGPPVMLYHLAKWVLSKGIPAQFSLESLMGCGVGACLGCVLPRNSSSPEPSYVHVCFEGPVFSPDVIEWEKLL